MFQTKKTPVAHVDKVGDIAPRIAAELTPKLGELGRERAAILVEARELAAAEPTPDESVDAARERRVAEILGRTAPQPRQSRAGRRAEIEMRVRDIDEAAEVLRRDIETERNRAAAIIRERVRPAYAKAVGDLCRAIVGLHEANLAYHSLVDTMADDGVSLGTLGNYSSNVIGSPRDSQSAIARLLREAVAEGFFPAKEVPEEFRA